ncbi:hypothetical protein RRG08_019131 [Elysia crispata]|uniref:EGF-like domain-containing protein n=1 Tax=Elysia crispata TaxID=231223 RepID=A0AAE1A2M9_9GAST|nr:hypothetical protein RRG08_019131 [Elysia crispata]
MGNYGRGCLERCSEKCVSLECHRETGACRWGCQIGYMGDTCQEVPEICELFGRTPLQGSRYLYIHESISQSVESEDCVCSCHNSCTLGLTQPRL